jgi:hypothetical protein
MKAYTEAPKRVGKALQGRIGTRGREHAEAEAENVEQSALIYLKLAISILPTSGPSPLAMAMMAMITMLLVRNVRKKVNELA